MSCIVYQTNKKTGTKYAYRSESYRDPKTGAPKSKRTYLGRVDPATGEIVPKASAGGRNTSPLGKIGPESTPDLMRELREARDEARRASERIAELEAEIASLRALVADAGAIALELSTKLGSADD